MKFLASALSHNMTQENKLLKLLISVFKTQNKPLTLQEIYFLILESKTGKQIFENYRKEEAKQSKIRTVIYNYCIDRYLYSHSDIYIFRSLYPKQNKGQKFSLID
jgi:hypothetical protein